MVTSYMTTQQLVWAVIVGGAIGYLSGMFGIGGGFLLVPILNIVLKIPMEFAVGAGACQALGPATTSMLARRITRYDLRLPLTIMGGLLMGAFVGAHMIECAEGSGTVTVAGNSIALTDLLVLTVYAVIMTLLGLFSLWDVRLARQGRSFQRGWIAAWSVPPYGSFPELDAPKVSITILACFGLVVGFLAGLLGMSGGLVLLPGLIYLLGLKTHRAVLNSIVIVWIVAILSTTAHAWHGNIDLVLVLALLLGGTIGARLGADHSIRLGGQQLRQRFGWLLLVAAFLIVVRLTTQLLR